MEAFETVARIVAPTPSKLIFVEVAREVRQARADHVRPTQATVLMTADAYLTEKDVHGPLRDIADLVLDGARGVDALVEEIVRALQHQH